MREPTHCRKSRGARAARPDHAADRHRSRPVEVDRHPLAEVAARDCPTRATAQSMQIVDDLIEGYKTIYGKALEGWDRSLADKEIRTIVDSGMDDANKNGRSARKAERATPPAWARPAAPWTPSANSWAWTPRPGEKSKRKKTVSLTWRT